MSSLQDASALRVTRPACRDPRDLLAAFEQPGLALLSFDEWGNVVAATGALPGGDAWQPINGAAFGKPLLDVTSSIAAQLAEPLARALTGSRAAARFALHEETIQVEIWPPKAGHSGLMLLVRASATAQGEGSLSSHKTAMPRCEILPEIIELLPEIHRRMGGFRELYWWVQRPALAAIVPRMVLQEALRHMTSLALIGLPREGVAILSAWETGINTHHAAGNPRSGGYVRFKLTLRSPHPIPEATIDEIGSASRSVVSGQWGTSFMTREGQVLAVHLLLTAATGAARVEEPRDPAT